MFHSFISQLKLEIRNFCYTTIRFVTIFKFFVDEWCSKKSMLSFLQTNAKYIPTPHFENSLLCLNFVKLKTNKAISTDDIQLCSFIYHIIRRSKRPSHQIRTREEECDRSFKSSDALLHSGKCTGIEHNRPVFACEESCRPSCNQSVELNG
jgi:hypothetical protein